jgi:hypothetical protein
MRLVGYLKREIFLHICVLLYTEQNGISRLEKKMAYP